MRNSIYKGMLAASVSALMLLGTIPNSAPWEVGAGAIGQAHAASGKSGGHRNDGGSPGSRGGGSTHSDGGHDDDSHSSHDDGHDDHDSGHDDDSHDSSEGKKGKGPRYQGGRVGGSKGKAGPGRTVVEKIFENE